MSSPARRRFRRTDATAGANFVSTAAVVDGVIALPAMFPYYRHRRHHRARAARGTPASWPRWPAGAITQLAANGLGAYIARHGRGRRFPRIVLGIVVMSLLVVLSTALLWRPLTVRRAQVPRRAEEMVHG